MLIQTSMNRPQAMRQPLEGRTAIVTGSTSGIGLGVAESLAAAGAAIVLNGFGDMNAIDALADRLTREHDVAVTYNSADMSKPDEIAMMVGDAERRFGQVDILVNNAGIQYLAPIESFPPEKWDAILAINLSAAFHLTRHVLAGMKERGFGRIVNVASAHGLIASPFKAAYVAAKHAVVGLTKTTALEAAEAGVTCNAICPGYVWTPLVEKQIDDQARAHAIPREQVIRDILLAKQPNKKFATVEEIGALAVFLCSDLAQSITGTAIPVDGGWTAQ